MYGISIPMLLCGANFNITKKQYRQVIVKFWQYISIALFTDIMAA